MDRDHAVVPGGAIRCAVPRIDIAVAASDIGNASVAFVYVHSRSCHNYIHSTAKYRR